MAILSFPVVGCCRDYLGTLFELAMIDFIIKTYVFLIKRVEAILLCVKQKRDMRVNKKAQLTQGLRATAVRVYRHLGFLKFESCTISSAVPENPTLEPNSSTSICKPVAKLWPFLYIQDGRPPPSWILSNRK